MPVMTSAVGERIRLRRQQLGLRQADLAARVGVSESAVLGWEKGRFFPSRHQGALEDVLGISLTASNITRLPPTDPRERELFDLLTAQDAPAQDRLTPAEAWEIVEEYRRRAQRRTA